MLACGVSYTAKAEILFVISLFLFDFLLRIKTQKTEVILHALNIT